MSLDITLSRVYHVSYDGCKTFIEKNEVVFDANITNNLVAMALEAGIHEAIWLPHDIGANNAEDLITILEKGYKSLLNNPNYFSKYNSTNGWGVYDDFLPFVKKYLDACKDYPNSVISVWF